MKELTIEWLEGLGYQADRLNKNIFVIKNFLTEHEVTMLMKTAEETSEEAWSEHYMGGLRNLAYRKFGRTDLDNMIAEGLVEVTRNWSDKNLAVPRRYSEDIDKRMAEIFAFNPDIVFNGAGTIQRMPEGIALGAHVDNHSDPSIEWAAVTYLNDDYAGGELYFKHLDIRIKPSSRSLVVFPGTPEYEHGVLPVKAGPVRYVIPGFVATKDFYQRRSIELDGYHD